ncbi:hypothetical protein FSP39_001158 [Pinctada imbricata]|uniref:Uncharacterized protein n=1 Tax=Pinctada imbricata TaxID=66713 RepID=A0AA88YFB3_PINIB|nr:hypothetical protein FSP39_001158 [Pinctada imbricata]
MDVDIDLQCPICLELFNYPIILPCSHVLCRSPCAEHLFDFNFIRCPVCRDNCYVSGGISSLPRVIALENIIERFKAASQNSKPDRKQSICSTLDASFDSITDNSILPSVCNLCSTSKKTKAIKTCLDCNASYCAKCLKMSHPNKEPFLSHELVSPNLDGRDLNQSDSGLCSTHGERLSLFCRDCTTTCCALCREDERHKDHQLVAVDEAYTDLKKVIEKSLEKLQQNQEKVRNSVQLQRDHLKDMQQMADKKREEINTQCDALLAEIENKRNFFLADLEYEERVRQNDQEDLIKVMDRILGSSQALYSYSKEVIKEDVGEFLEVAPTLSEKLVKSTIECETAQYEPHDAQLLCAKVVDFRKEKQVLRDMNYLTAPSTPSIDVTRCSRSEDTVVLVICPPNNIHDVIDQYEIHYCSEEQKSLEIEETLIVKNSIEERQIGKGVPNSAGLIVVLVENLCKSTTYYFCVSAANQTGKSLNSEVVQCTTLLQGESVIPVPVIVESLCRQFTSSIQIYCASPQDIAVEQHISHFLLYRTLGYSKPWRTLSLYGRQEHRVFGLESNSEYEFLVLACNQRGECQISNRVILQTESS